MGRPKEFTTLLTGHAGYATLPRPDIARPKDRLAWAENVWLGGEAGIATRRGGMTAVPDIIGTSAPVYQINGMLGVPAIVNLGTALVCSESSSRDRWYVARAPGSSSDGSWTVKSVPAEVQLSASISPVEEYFPAQVAVLGSKAVFCTPWRQEHTRLALMDLSNDYSIRLAGFGTPNTPTAADNGSGTYSGVRYYRIRVATQVSGVTTRRSEPSTAITVTPSGSGASITVTCPAVLPNEGETHWEIEASADNAAFYRLSTIAIATTTYSDSTAPADYDTIGTLSETVGNRTAPNQCRTVVADGDRFLFGGDWRSIWSSPTYGTRNRVYYTPVLGTTDIADDECVPTDNYLDVEPGDGDEITAMAGPLNDAIILFKRWHIYQLTRTGNEDAPYDILPLATGMGVRGPAYVTQGVDAAGAPCLYFSDTSGYWRYGVGGFTRLDADLNRSVHVNPRPRTVYHPGRRAVLFGELVYHVGTGGWSRMQWNTSVYSTTVAEFQVAGVYFDTATYSYGLWTPMLWGPMVEQIYVLDSGTTDGGTAFTARLGLTRMIAELGKRWVPTRCQIWGTGGGPLTVSVVTDSDPVTAIGTLDTAALTEVGEVWIPSEQQESGVVPLNLGIGPVFACGVWLTDLTDATTTWRIDAVELSGQVQEPLP